MSDRSDSRSVHPHMRGDNDPNKLAQDFVDGSPPHAWGQCYTRQCADRRGRFTPTCVGTIACAKSIAWGIPVHPHMRGDNGVDVQRQIPVLGSPPHAWGQCDPHPPRPAAHRFTPTCVGTIQGSGKSARRDAVHPHMRGDNIKDYGDSVDQTGSPPHAWGQWIVSASSVPHQRFTPTCVGTMISFSVTVTPLPGSPPHAWGQWEGPKALPSRRLVHPHMRGDNYKSRRHLHLSNGSPPHAWGQFFLFTFKVLNARFTPTCVGTMISLSARVTLKYGSPPHAWGQSASSQ